MRKGNLTFEIFDTLSQCVNQRIFINHWISR